MYRAKVNNKPRIIKSDKYILKNFRIYQTPEIKPIIVKEFLIKLPPEILYYICEFLDYKSVNNISKTCKSLRYLKTLFVSKYFANIIPYHSSRFWLSFMGYVYHIQSADTSEQVGMIRFSY